MPDLPDSVWVRSWSFQQCHTDRVKNVLSEIAPGLGFGIDDPFEIRLADSQLTSFTVAGGRTLAEWLTRKRRFTLEETLDLVEQLCFALSRVYQRSRRLHGAVNPFNVRYDDNLTATLWSVPTAALELECEDADPHWEQPYRCPSGTNDVYSLGVLMLKLLSVDNEQFHFFQESGTHELILEEGPREVISACLEGKISGVRDMAKALNSETSLARIDEGGAEVLEQKALESFAAGEVEKALEFWSSALASDWLSVTTQLGTGVAHQRLGRWSESTEYFEKARRIATTNPTVETALGLSLLKLGESVEAERLFLRATLLNPWYAEPLRLLSESARKRDDHERALQWALKSLTLQPKSFAGRQCAAEAFDKLGNADEARCHREYAKSVKEQPPLWDLLIKAGDPPPWGKIRTANDPSSAERFGIKRKKPPRPWISHLRDSSVLY